jgi:hypothetical protein
MLTVTDPPQPRGACGSSGCVFQRHSRTVIVCVAMSTVAIWKDSYVTSLPERPPFIGESTRNV